MFSDTLTNLFQLTLSGLAVGSIYAVVALGFVILYKATDIFNFAQGELMTLGAFIGYFFIVQLHIPIFWAFLLTFIGWLPAVFAGREFSHSVLYYTAPRISGMIFHLASLSMAASIVLSLCLLPPKKEKHSVLKRIGYAFEWLLVPFTIVFLSALPALDAQTRLMMGKYMTFWVTDKGRVDKKEKNEQ